MTQAQPVTFQQLLDEHAPDLAATVAGARSSITDDALSSKVKTLMMMICDSLLNHEWRDQSGHPRSCPGASKMKSRRR